ncbi:urea transport system substrate-binding protein [Aminobacter lissarensis]|uniref:Urea transport system substrate-binding protein n=1 Tax=Aminobacter carboxidus TaxID=376165 RepID=A0A8E2BE57_9HYPH|nr:transporter substrate-binding domain-containing protein [Aminobacter lissarensis]MBB6467994.1 urea transport system substrate-binding protein [Aminobacter lissarensis]
MTITRRNLIKNAGGAAIVAVAAPNLILSTASAAQPWIAKGGTIKVGVLFSQSGPLAVVENDSTQVVRFAIDEINANGGVAGLQIEPVVIDAKSDIKIYSEKISQLILRDRVISTFGGYTSASRRAVAPIVMARDHLFYYPTCYEGRECTQNIINTGPLANQHSQDLIPFMVENFGKKVYLVGSNYIWPKESNKNAKVWLEKVGGEVVGEEYVPLGGSEFAPIFNKIRQAKPDFIFSTVIGDSDVAMHKQFLEEGFKADKLPIASLTTGEIEVRAMGAEAGAGHFLSAPYFQALDNPTNHRFVENYLKSPYGGGGVTHYNMEETYLAVYAWKAGLEKALAQAGDIEAVTPRMIRDASGGIVLDDDISPEGKVWIDPDNFNIWLKPKIGQCQGDGQFKIIRAAAEHVAPDPMSIYPERGVCKADGLHAPDGTIQKNVL